MAFFSLRLEDIDKMFCSSCGYELLANSNYCHRCGSGKSNIILIHISPKYVSLHVACFSLWRTVAHQVMAKFMKGLGQASSAELTNPPIQLRNGQKRRKRERKRNRGESSVD